MSRIKRAIREKVPEDTGMVRDYMQFLYEIISDKKGEYLADEHSLLLICLRKTEFLVLVPRDENREHDGKDLRKEFAEKNSIDDISEIEGPCSLLEMLVALSRRIGGILYTHTEGENVPRWFWEIIKSAELFEQDDKHFEPDFVFQKLQNIAERRYKRDGTGSFFGKFKMHKADISVTEIWYQAMWWIDEKGF